MRPLRILLASAFAVLLGAVGVAVTPSSAHAEDIYRYWAYFTVEGDAFVAAQTGPAGATPADGSVEGYRWAAPADFTNPNVPRADLQKVTFDSVCEGVTAADGEKRVAVLIDYGVEQDAPDGVTPPEPQAVCAVAPVDANGIQTLEAAVAKVRTQPGSFGPMLCGISDFPSTGCADEIADSGTPTDEPTVEFAIGDDEATTAGEAEAADSESDDGTNVWLLVGVGVLVVVVVVGGVLLNRRRSS